MASSAKRSGIYRCPNVEMLKYSPSRSSLQCIPLSRPRQFGFTLTLDCQDISSWLMPFAGRGGPVAVPQRNRGGQGSVTPWASDPNCCHNVSEFVAEDSRVPVPPAIVPASGCRCSVQHDALGCQSRGARFALRQVPAHHGPSHTKYSPHAPLHPKPTLHPIYPPRCRRKLSKRSKGVPQETLKRN